MEAYSQLVTIGETRSILEYSDFNFVVVPLVLYFNVPNSD